MKDHSIKEDEPVARVEVCISVYSTDSAQSC